jgi:hypothetical protein
MLKIGQRWALRATPIETCMQRLAVFEVVEIKNYNAGSCDAAMCRVVQIDNNYYYHIGETVSCGSFPKNSNANSSWYLLEGQDAPVAPEIR